MGSDTVAPPVLDETEGEAGRRRWLLPATAGLLGLALAGGLTVALIGSEGDNRPQSGSATTSEASTTSGDSGVQDEVPLPSAVGDMQARQQAFERAVNAQGINVNSGALDAGFKICTSLHDGAAPAAVSRDLTDRGATTDDADYLVRASVSALCPQQFNDQVGDSPPEVDYSAKASTIISALCTHGSNPGSPVAVDQSGMSTRYKFADPGHQYVTTLIFAEGVPTRWETDCGTELFSGPFTY